MTDKDKMTDEFRTFINSHLPPEMLEDQTSKDYIVMLATTYFSDETTEDKLNSYFGELIENQEIRDPLIQKIKELKKSSTSVPKIDAKPEPAKSQVKVEEKPPKVKQQEKQAKLKEKTKIFQRMEEGAPKKRVKKEVTGEEKEGEEMLTDEKKAGLKKKLQSQGKQKCRFFPFCKNPQTCEFFHPQQKVLFSPSSKKQTKQTSRTCIKNQLKRKEKKISQKEKMQVH